MKIFKALKHLFGLIGIAFALWYFIPKILPAESLTPFQIIGLSLSMAFLWVEILRIGITKPFNCVKCMTGWTGLLIGCSQIGWHGIIYLPVCLFVGSMFEAFKMRWL